MRPGPLEIVIILAVILAVIILARTFRRPAAATAGKKSSSGSTWKMLKRLGVVLIVVGIVYFVGAIGVFEMLGWALRSYLWALPAIIIGIIFVLLAQRR